MGEADRTSVCGARQRKLRQLGAKRFQISRLFLQTFPKIPFVVLFVFNASQAARARFRFSCKFLRHLRPAGAPTRSALRQAAEIRSHEFDLWQR
jgi:hypothetical protein